MIEKDIIVVQGAIEYLHKKYITNTDITVQQDQLREASH